MAFAWRDCGKPWTTHATIVGNSGEIRTEHLANTSLERYLYTSLSAIAIIIIISSSSSSSSSSSFKFRNV
jgi:hypothetical protein